MDVEELRRVYASNVAAKALCDLMAARKNNQSETKLDRIIGLLQSKGHDVKRNEMIAAFRRLEQCGCGQFIEGRRGWPSRFVWQVGSVSACRAAIGETSTVDNIGQTAEDADADITLLTHVYNLRADLQIEFALPMDLTASEAERVATFIKTLPFEEYE